MNTSTRGTKRKRPANEKKKENTSTISTKLVSWTHSYAGDDDSELTLPYHPVQHHSLQLINRAAKKAKTFEVQKLVRKIKDDKGKKPATAGSSPEELASVLDALKELDVDTFVTAVWLSRLSKDKTGLAENEHVKQYCDELRRKEGAGKQATEDPSSPAGKAKNRIMAHKVFQEELKSVLKGLKEKAGLEDRASGSSARKDKPVTATPASSKDKKGREDESDALAALAKLSAKKGKARQMDEDDSDATSDTSDEETSDEDEEDDDDATVSHISADEDEMRAAEIGFDGMTGGSDSDEDDEPSSASEAGDDDDNVSVASSSSFSVKKEKASKEKAKNEKALKEKPLPPLKTTTSAFLPSLAAGYTIGDEDGSVYGSDEDGAGSAQVVRKNRRGQRARQASVAVAVRQENVPADASI